MKKSLIIMLAAAAMAAQADIAVLWNNNGYVADETQGYADAGPVLTQLIWSPTAPVGIASLNGGLVAGEYVLDSGFYAWGYFADNTTVQVVTSDEVGGAGGTGYINTGYLFVRTWNIEGTYYNQTATINPVLKDYVSTDTGTIITVNLVATGDYTNIQAVPEPATFGLLAIGGISAWLVRRNKLKAKEMADA